MESLVASTASARSLAAVDQDAVLGRPSAQPSRLTVVATTRAATTVAGSYWTGVITVLSARWSAAFLNVS
ncbi:MAG: hypothetical protein JWR70_379 [Modestobacter sp.]|jgi:hypothetical protein|nr:hypothetical protein [Modestobacter sp.]